MRHSAEPLSNRHRDDFKETATQTETACHELNMAAVRKLKSADSVGVLRSKVRWGGNRETLKSLQNGTKVSMDLLQDKVRVCLLTVHLN